MCRTFLFFSILFLTFLSNNISLYRLNCFTAQGMTDELWSTELKPTIVLTVLINLFSVMQILTFWNIWEVGPICSWHLIYIKMLYTDVLALIVSLVYRELNYYSKHSGNPEKPWSNNTNLFFSSSVSMNFKTFIYEFKLEVSQEVPY